MSGIYHLEITESEEELKRLLQQQKSATDKDQVHLLYLLQSDRHTPQQARVPQHNGKGIVYAASFKNG